VKENSKVKKQGTKGARDGHSRPDPMQREVTPFNKDIATRINEAYYARMAQNDEPHFIYLGNEEWTQLCKWIQDSSIFSRALWPEYFYGCRVYKVNATNHINVV
jgi:hypothetical protein